MGWLGVPLIQTYRGFGTEEEVYIRGRVIEDHGILQPKPHDSKWKNLLSMFKRYASSGLPGVKIKVAFYSQVKETVSDDDGYFEVYFQPGTHINHRKRWHEVVFELPNISSNGISSHCVKGEVLIPRENCHYGIISDIDDTFLVSYSTDVLRKIRLMAIKNAHTRLPFDGVTAFYNALHRGKTGRSHNPLFYVSSSEWHIYDLLKDFCKVQNIPRGIFLLRDMEHSIFKFWKAGQGNHDHKLEKIRMIFDVYDGLKFFLIGDSGQRDVEIYSQIAEEFPDRIQAVYIRDVSSRRRYDEVLHYAHKLDRLGIDLELVKDTEAAARHALQHNYISKIAFEEVMADKKHNLELPSDIEELLHIGEWD
ncbi:phosphatase domain-containing protein [Rapidithrix thailandica]|uniref:Phosphatase domain-containing protein n=2 Tax=Rapidithrix thailandica TaxID=413964 RepID=A0AAW9S1B3_9BACT